MPDIKVLSCVSLSSLGFKQVAFHALSSLSKYPLSDIYYTGGVFWESSVKGDKYRAEKKS